MSGQGLYLTVEEERSVLKTKPEINRKGRSRAQGLMEFALVIPLLMAVILGVIEFGFFFFVYSSVNSAAREAVRYGSGAGMSEMSVPYFQDCQGIRAAAQRIGRYAGMSSAQISIGLDQGPDTAVDWSHCPVGEATTSNDAALGDRIVVRIVVPYDPIVSMLGFPSISVRAQSARTILRGMELQGTPGATRTSQYTRTPTQVIFGETPIPTTTQSGGGGSGTEETPEVYPTATQKTPEPPPVCLTPIELGGCE